MDGWMLGRLMGVGTVVRVGWAGYGPYVVYSSVVRSSWRGRGQGKWKSETMKICNLHSLFFLLSVECGAVRGWGRDRFYSCKIKHRRENNNNNNNCRQIPKSS